MTSLSNSHKSDTISLVSPSWALGLTALLGGWALMLAIFFGTSASLVRTWLSSDLYGHGFLVLPIAGYMLWRRRRHLKSIPVQPFIWGIAGIGLAGVVWLIGEVTTTNTLTHLGLIGMLQGHFVTVFGPAIARKSAFPLLFLFMAVPFGSGLIEPLQLITAEGTVLLLQLTGIPVHLDSYLLAIPAGRFYIAEACAGARFLLSTLALAWLAADVLYASPWRRLAFIGLAVVISLVANTLRAYSILLIATLSGPSSAAAFDHVTYGLVFLGFVMLLLLLTGLLFRDRNTVAAPLSRARVSPTQDTRKPVAGIVVVTLLSLIIAALPAIFVGSRNKVGIHISETTLAAPKTAAPWRSVPDATAHWRPRVPGVDADILETYASGAAEVGLYIGYFGEERQGAEVVNELIDWTGHGGWRKLEMTKATLPVGGAALETPCLRLARGVERRLICYWYWVDGQMTGSPYVAKLLRARALIFGGLRSAAVLAVSESGAERPESGVKVLRNFLAAVEPLDALLDVRAEAR